MRHGALGAVLVFAFLSGCADVRIEAAQERTAALEAGTTFDVVLLDALNSRTAKAGDRFSAEITSPVTYGDCVVIPPKSTIHGLVDEAASPVMKLAQPGTVRMVFDRIETPDGRVIPVHAGIHKDYDAAKAANKLGGAVGEHFGEQELRAQGAGGVLLPLKAVKAARKAEEFRNKQKDVVIPAGTPLTLALKDATPVPLDAATAAGVSDADWARAGGLYRAQAAARPAPAPEPPATLRGALREGLGTAREERREMRRELLGGGGGVE